MTNESLLLLVEDLIDYIIIVEKAIARLKSQIYKNFGQKKTMWNPEKIKWGHMKGSNGQYERSKDLNNPDFKAFLKVLAAHGGKLTRDEWFDWTFKNGLTVGRKRQELNV